MKRFLLTTCLLFAISYGLAQDDGELIAVDTAAVYQEPLKQLPGEDYEVDPDAFFIEHKVLMGEKIFMISRKYMVDPFDIYEYNDAVNGVKDGTILYIPLHKSKKKDLDKFKAELVKRNGGQPIQVGAPPKREKEALYEEKEEEGGF